MRRGARTRIVRRLGACSLAVGVFATASPAWALPTPDLLVGLANVFPLLAGTAVAACTGAYLALKRRLGAEKGSFFAGALLGFFLLSSVLIVFGLRAVVRAKEQRRVDDLAMYLRCDYGAHEVIATRRQGSGAPSAWRSFGNFEWVTMREAEALFARERDAALLATYRWEIEYESGIPGLVADGKLSLFELVRRSDLTTRLQTVTARDLYLARFQPYLEDPDLLAGPKEVFRKFRHVYVVGDVDPTDRYVRRSGTVRRANPRTIAWPVVAEDWLLDQEHVSFPGFTRLLEDDETARLLKEDATYVVAPFDGALRTPDVYRNEYLGVLLADVAPSRVLIVDLNAPDLSARLEEIARQLDGRSFGVVGISKYDYLYHGLEFAHAMWMRMGRDPNRFLLAGFTTRLPEAVARNWVAQSRRDALSYLERPFERALGALSAGLGVPIGAALFLFGGLVKLACSPIALLEARARFLRKRIEIREREGSAPWRGSGAVLLRKLGGLRAHEVVGTLLTLVLLFPAYRLITGSDLVRGGFLWIEDLAQSDPGMSAIAAAAVLVKLLADGSARGSVAVFAAVAFGFLLLLLPSAVLLYAAGVMVVGAASSFAAQAHGRRALSRALLEAR